jgi:hypothetical protein
MYIVYVLCMQISNDFKMKMHFGSNNIIPFLFSSYEKDWFHLQFFLLQFFTFAISHYLGWIEAPHTQNFEIS